ncbi:MAG TPA: hypothetical protein VN944_09505 [Nitrospiria bacterium]|nr:hypothetical protein [Nitrospiria bacterium]
MNVESLPVSETVSGGIKNLSKVKMAGLVVFLILLNGVVLFGPEFLGNWAHDRFHSYRHSVGMACH